MRFYNLDQTAIDNTLAPTTPATLAIIAAGFLFVNEQNFQVEIWVGCQVGEADQFQEKVFQTPAPGRFTPGTGLVSHGRKIQYPFL
jgi:hypothetical protein